MGRVPTTSNTMLNTAAQRHSCYMASYDVMSHTGGPNADDRSMVDRVTKTGYKYSAIGENVAKGQTTARSVMTAWLNSAGHRKNIESINFNEIGVGLKQSDDGSRYWTQVFGKQGNNQKIGKTTESCLKNLPDL